MGLDMYLYKVREDGRPAEINYAGPDEEQVTFTLPGDEVAYWRKANQIHDYFVKKVQDGNDDCGEYPVTTDDLKLLYKLCRQALVDRNVEILPTCEGFFFGSTEVDAWYWENLIDTVIMLHPLIQPKVYEHGAEYVYSSSW